METRDIYTTVTLHVQSRVFYEVLNDIETEIYERCFVAKNNKHTFFKTINGENWIRYKLIQDVINELEEKYIGRDN